ncbi:MAG: type IX secretion system membrane protein PorP/SprF [Bacteroidales bacterium]|nr:type IX secretion system membrane protein PorP/SprF [Bacteroidales bacterium]
MCLTDYSINRNLPDPLDSYDMELSNINRLPLVPDRDFGLYFNTGHFYVGASVNDLLRQDYHLEL